MALHSREDSLEVIAAGVQRARAWVAASTREDPVGFDAIVDIRRLLALPLEGAVELSVTKPHLVIKRDSETIKIQRFTGDVEDMVVGPDLPSDLDYGEVPGGISHTADFGVGVHACIYVMPTGLVTTNTFLWGFVPVETPFEQCAIHQDLGRCGGMAIGLSGNSAFLMDEEGVEVQLPLVNREHMPTAYTKIFSGDPLCEMRVQCADLRSWLDFAALQGAPEGKEDVRVYMVHKEEHPDTLFLHWQGAHGGTGEEGVSISVLVHGTTPPAPLIYDVGLITRSLTGMPAEVEMTFVSIGQGTALRFTCDTHQTAVLPLVQ